MTESATDSLLEFNLFEDSLLHVDGEEETRPANPIDEANALFGQCDSTDKMNLSYGVYLMECNRLYKYSVVRKVEERLARNKERTNMYLDPEGLTKFNIRIQNYFFADYDCEFECGKMRILQTLSATGALNLSLRLLRSYCGFETIYVSNFYYHCYRDIIEESGIRDMRFYPYYDLKSDCLSFDALVQHLQDCDHKAIYLFNTCAHNPTGNDLTHEQWRIVAEIIKTKQIVPIMDSAYLGMITGDPVADFHPVHMLIDMDMEFFCTISFSKCLGLYSERVGSLVFRSKYDSVCERVLKKASDIINGHYMCPPKYPAEVVSQILGSPVLVSEWKQELASIVRRLSNTRQQLFDSLRVAEVPGDWSRVLHQKGFFVLFDLSDEVVQALMEKHNIFFPKDGRINVAALNEDKIEKLVHAMKDCLSN